MATDSSNVVILGGDPNDETSLLDILDHVLNSGVVIHGTLVISLAGVDLVYVGLNVILTSIETAVRHLNGRTPASGTVSVSGRLRGVSGN